MRIKLINPNSTESMTLGCLEGARPFLRPGTELLGATSESGPASIDSYYEDALSVPGVLAEVRKGESEGVDAYIIACFDDPGLLAARELTEKPVVGIGEAAIVTARLLATCFSVVTPGHRSRHIVEHLLRNNGALGFCRSIRTTEADVLGFEQNPGLGLRVLAEEARLAVAQDRAEAIVLGCAGFTRFAPELTRDLGVPVIDGVVPAVKLAESLVEMGLKTSKVWTLEQPPIKDR